MIQENDYLTSIDLSDAFLHIPIHPQFHRFLRFQWAGTTYQVRTTPFGLSFVPWLFTKICKPILEWARSQGIRISAYIDDWILIADNRETAIHQTQMVVRKLQQLGWIVNFGKSHLTPTQQLEHLGFKINTTTLNAYLPIKKLRDIRKSIQQVLKNPVQTPTSSGSPQSNNENSSSHFRIDTGEVVHITADALQKQAGKTIITSLGSADAGSTLVYSRVKLVESASSAMEWSQQYVGQQTNYTEDTAIIHQLE